LALAEAKGVRHTIGLQWRLGPSARYTRDLVKQGYVGKVRSARMTVSADAFVSTMSERHAWAFDATNFSNVLSIYGGHFMDVLFQAVGFPEKLAAVTQVYSPSSTLSRQVYRL
jgi:predicted dehydrogenase